MNIYGHLKVAEEMELHKGFAIQAKKRFITRQLLFIDDDVDYYFGWVDGVFDINEVFALHSLDRLCREKSKLKKEYERIMQILKPTTGDITEAMIESARAYPVEKLIEFNHGKATAFCHEDKNPSMFHATRTNTAACPVCDRHYNSIDVLLQRDGMSFVAAVKQLQ
jgi:hypothetical protein